MSKSLKNFTTIKDALTRNSAAEIRFLFLLQKYNSAMDFGSDSMGNARVMLRSFKEFLQNVRVERRGRGGQERERWAAVDKTLNASFRATKLVVHEALLDDFNTPAVLAALQKLVKECNLVISTARSLLLASIAKYVEEMFHIFGISASSEGGEGGATLEETLSPVLDAVVAFRDDVRAAGKAGDAGAVLKACDAVRDESLAAAGVRVEDGGAGAKSTWKLESPEEIALRKKEVEEARVAKAARAAKAKEAAAEKAAQAAIPPKDLFKLGAAYVGKFASFNGDTGLPETTPDGKPVSKGMLKKLQKKLDAHTKAYEAK